MYEGCVNRLRFCVMNAHNCVVCPIEGDCDGLDAVMSQAADAIKELDLLRDQALKRLCEWCGVCPEDKRNARDCEIAMLDANPERKRAFRSDGGGGGDAFYFRTNARRHARRDGNMSDVKLWKLRCPECGFVFVVGTARVLPDKSVKELKECPCGAVMIEDESLPPYNELPSFDDRGGNL